MSKRLFSLICFLSCVLLTKAAVSRKPGVAGWRLYQEIIGKYNKYILPVATTKNKVDIHLLLKLVSLMDIDEKNQIMTTMVWVRHEWYDANLVWNPREYNNITKVQLSFSDPFWTEVREDLTQRVYQFLEFPLLVFSTHFIFNEFNEFFTTQPADDLWLPDTVLYNNADGDYQITIRTKVMVYHNGRIVWLPPAIYKSFCAINVKFFPFDEQICELKFGPWSYDISKVDYWLYFSHDHISYNKTNYLAKAADMAEYSDSCEWDVLHVTGKRTEWHYPCCPEKYVDITYRIHIRRKTLYYTINLIIPVVLITFLTIFVFYLPSQSGEKITLSISILVSLTFFILTLYEIIPPTSLALPLMSKYLLFTTTLVTLSIIITILILTLHFRHAHAYDMPGWIRRLFLIFLPPMLFYESPAMKARRNLSKEGVNDTSVESLGAHDEASQSLDVYQPIPRQNGEDEDDFEADSLSYGVQHRHSQKSNKSSSYGGLDHHAIYENVRFLRAAPRGLINKQVLKAALRDVHYISNYFRESTEEERKKADWEAVARVIDRLFLFIFTAAVVIGTCAILASAPALYT